jgi:hypothetical protein
MYDFITMRRPAIVSRTNSVDDYFDDDALEKFTAGDPTDLARAIRALRADPTRTARLVEHATKVNEPHRWVHQREIYLEVVASLTTGKSRMARASEVVAKPTSGAS